VWWGCSQTAVADRDVLNSLPSRTVEQDVLDLIDRIPIQPNSCAPSGALLIGSTRTHNAFLNSYSLEDEGLYDDY
jgi:hypothetical protein